MTSCLLASTLITWKLRMRLGVYYCLLTPVLSRCKVEKPCPGCSLTHPSMLPHLSGSFMTSSMIRTFHCVTCYLPSWLWLTVTSSAQTAILLRPRLRQAPPTPALPDAKSAPSHFASWSLKNLQKTRQLRHFTSYYLSKTQLCFV